MRRLHLPAGREAQSATRAERSPPPGERERQPGSPGDVPLLCLASREDLDLVQDLGRWGGLSRLFHPDRQPIAAGGQILRKEQVPIIHNEGTHRPLSRGMPEEETIPRGKRLPAEAPPGIHQRGTEMNLGAMSGPSLPVKGEMELTGWRENAPGSRAHPSRACMLEPSQDPSARERQEGGSSPWRKILPLPADRVGPDADLLRENFHPNRIPGPQHLIHQVLGIGPVRVGPDIPEGLILLQAQVV